MFGFFRRTRQPATAAAAKDRLQVLLAHERSDRTRAELLPRLQRDIIEAVRRHVQVKREAVAVELQTSGNVSTLEINVELPEAEIAPPATALQPA